MAGNHNRLGPTGLNHIALTVPDMGPADAFYSSFGLEQRAEGDRLNFRCVGREQDQVQLFEGPKKSFHHVSFTIAPGSADEYRRNLVEHGVRIVDAPAHANQAGIWFLDPDDRHVHVIEGEQAAPRVVEPLPWNFASGYTRTDQPRWQQLLGKRAEPRRLGHSLVFSPDIERLERFYIDIVGFRLSDRLKGLVTFMNVGEGDHHVFGFIQSTHVGFHHASFEVESFDDIGLGAQQMAANGFQDGFGLGRHTLGSNLFYYARDPWGSWVEYFSDIDQVSCNWVANDWEVPPASWAPELHPEFLANPEAP